MWGVLWKGAVPFRWGIARLFAEGKREVTRLMLRYEICRVTCRRSSELYAVRKNLLSAFCGKQFGGRATENSGV